jgi:RNA polymerase sigma factor (sigma-70 family)
MAQQQSTWPESTKLASLVREAQCSVSGAVEALLAALRPSLLGFFCARLPRELAEDLTQNALIRIAGALPRIDPERADAYVGTVARNLLRTAHRRRAIEGRRRVQADLEAIPIDRESIDVRVEREELVRVVHAVIESKLPAPLAETVRALLNGSTPAEIAADQGVSPVTVRTRLMRARTILRAELGGQLDSAEVELPTAPRRHRVSGLSITGT